MTCIVTQRFDSATYLYELGLLYSYLNDALEYLPLLTNIFVFVAFQLWKIINILVLSSRVTLIDTEPGFYKITHPDILVFSDAVR